MQNSPSSSLSETTRIEVNVSEFSCGEVSVKLRRDNTLLVYALHLEQYTLDNYFRKELVKTYPLPIGADVDKIRSVIRNTGILTIDIPLLKDSDTSRRSNKDLLKNDGQSKKPPKSDSSHFNVNDDRVNSNHSTIRTPPLTTPKRTGSLGDINHHQSFVRCSTFNIADFLQSKFHPAFTSNGKKLILKVYTRGYDPDELSVRLIDNNLLVQGRKKSLVHAKRSDSRQFSQSIRLPDGIDKYNVTSQVMENGVLVIDIPLLNSALHY